MKRGFTEIEPEIEPLRFVVLGHGSRLPWRHTAPDNLPGYSQWFKAGERTSLFFPNDVFSNRIGGCKLTTKTRLETVERVCRNFAYNSGVRTPEQLAFIRDKGEKRARGKSMKSSGWPKEYFFATPAPAKTPLYPNNSCVPNMAFTAKSAQTGDFQAGVYQCTGSGEVRLVYAFPTRDEVTSGNALPTTLESVVRLCEGQAAQDWRSVEIFVMACTTSSGLDRDGNPTHFLRPADVLRNYNPGVLDPHQRDCDNWARQTIRPPEDQAPEGGKPRRKGKLARTRRSIKKARRSIKKTRRSRKKTRRKIGVRGGNRFTGL